MGTGFFFSWWHNILVFANMNMFSGKNVSHLYLYSRLRLFLREYHRKKKINNAKVNPRISAA